MILEAGETTVLASLSKMLLHTSGKSSPGALVTGGEASLKGLAGEDEIPGDCEQRLGSGPLNYICSQIRLGELSESPSDILNLISGGRTAAASAEAES